MRRVLLFSAFVVCLTANVKAQTPNAAPRAKAAPPSTSSAAIQAARASFAKLPLSFEENAGQTDGRVKYMSRGSDYSLFLTSNEAVFALRGGSSPLNCAGVSGKPARNCADIQKYNKNDSVLWLKMLGANVSAQVSGSDPLPGKINYYIGNDPRKWHTGVRQFGRVSYQGIYLGVDLTYYGNQQQLESDFVVAPGASPRSIQFEIAGARQTRIDAQGNLILTSDAGNVRLLKPVVYQFVKSKKQDVSGRYILLAENRVGFEIGKYDLHAPLVIDPTFVYSTYLGGGALTSGGDQGLAIAIDSTGAAFITGTGSSVDFPGSAPSGPVGQFGTPTPYAFVTKFNPAGSTLVYSTLLRGNTGFNDSGNGIGVDGAGNAYVAGITSDADFPLLNPFQATIGDVFSAGFNFLQSGFVAGLAGDGTLIYSTYFGGRNNSDQTTLSGLAADAAGNAYVVGSTSSLNFPTINPYQATQNSTFGGQNVVIAKFNPQGQPIYSTYLGGGGDDVGNAIAVDANGNAYVTGQTSSNASFETGFPVQTSPAPFQGTINGSANAFVAKFSFTSPNLTLANSTYLGGSSTDEAFGIAVDSATPPNVYLTGLTQSKTGTPFPTKNPIFGPSAGSLSEAFVTKLNGTFSALVYSTFLGGTGSAGNFTGDSGNAIALDGANPPNAFVTGSTPSTNFPVVNPLQSAIGSGATSNAFVTEVNGAGSALTYSTYLGGRGSDKGLGIAVASNGDAYITGTSTSTNFPVSGSGGTAPYQGELRTSAGNAFVTKISSAAAPSALNIFPPSFNFHSVGVGLASSPEPVTLSNNTALAVTINAGGITFTGSNAGDFSQTNTCPVSPATLGAGASCIISVVFNPTLQDGRTAQLSVASSAPTATMNLSGFGAVPEISFNQTNINFGTNDPLNVGALGFLSITNKGGTPLHVGNVQIAGTNPSAFAVSSNSCASVPANGGSCFLQLTFTPTAAQAYSATLLINDDAAGSPQSIPMTGTGVAQVIVTPHSIEYGGWLVNTSSFDSTISMQNGTSGNITLTSITPSGNSGDFPIDANNGTTCVANLVLLPGVSCNLEVFFKPTVGSAFDGRTATYTFNWTGAASGSQPVTVVGTGETGFTLYKNSYTAPSEYVGATESQQNFDQVFNGNAFPVTVSSIVLSGANPQDYVVQLDTSCSTNGVIPANSVCYLDGSFLPSAVGTRTATATINYTPPGGSSLVLSLTGTGLAGPVQFPAAYDMGTQIVNVTGPTQRVVLQNVQKIPLAISAVTPPAGSEFAIVNSTAQGACKVGTVLGGGNCFFDLTFTPSATGSRTASITVTDNGPGSPRTLNLRGTGVPAADTISVSPNALDFGNVVLVVPSSGQPTVTQTFYLTNAGATSTTINIAPVLTTPGAPFGFATGGAAGTCVQNKVVLPQGGTCSVVVTFKPTATGLQSNSVTLTDSVGGLHTISVQGTGVNQGVMSFGSSLTFNQLPNTTTATPLTATLTNSGSGPLTINSLYLTGANATNFAIVPGQTTCAPGTTGVTLPAAPGPGNTCVVALTFTAPNTVGTYRATVSVTANLGNNVKGSTSTSLTGNVVAGGVSASPNPIDFGTVALGSTLTYSSLHNFNSITVTNNNPAAITITSVAPQAAGAFTVTGNNCLKTLQPPAQFSSQNTCDFDVTFASATNGAEPANKIVVTYNVAGGASGQQFLIPLTGAGSNGLVAMPSPLSVTSPVGSPQSPSVTIGNGTSSTINVTGVGAITGPGAANFSVNFEACTGTSLFPSGNPFGTTCQIFFTYNPTAPGTNVAAQIPVSYNIGGGATQTLTVNLSGSATAAQVSIVPSQTPPTPLIFPGQALNTQSLVLSVLITNTGNDVLNFSGLKITGTNSNDFALAPQQQNSTTSQYASVIPCSNFGFGSLDPGQSCTIPLTFTPAPPPLPGGSLRSATLTITDNAYPSKTQTVLLEGNASSGSVTVSPTNISFSDTNVGSSVTQSVLVTNGSSSAVTFTSATFGTTSYSVDAAQTLNACSAAKPLSAFTGSCVVYIKFSPKTGANPDTATIHTSANSPTVTLSGNGVNPNVNATPTTLTFSSQAVGTQSSPQAVTLSNPTGTTVTISSTPTISGTNPGDFIFGTNTCTTGANVPATTGSCVVNVIFQPAAAGGTGRTATLSISDSPDATSPHLVTLSGTAIQPVASLSGNTIAFGNSNVGVASSQITVTLTNTGNANLSLSNIALGGTNPGDFAIVVPSSGTQCTNATVLAASASCVVAATFTPTAASARSATITITDNSTPTTQVITLSGTGTQPGISFLPTTIPFGNQRQGVASTQKTTVLTNSGSGTLTITSVTLAGTNPADFALVAPSSGTDCRTVGTVPAAGTCTIAVTFTPAALGGRSATITVADNASGSPHTAAVTGTGVFPQATPTPSPLPFGNQRQNTTSTVQTLTLTNGGTDTLNLTSVALAGTNASQFAIVGTGTTCTNGSTVAAAGTCVVKVTFTPTALGAQTATITFTDDATPTTQVVNLTGTGVFPQATPTPSPLQFGNQRQNTTSTVQTLTLTNGGTGTLNLTSVALAGTNASQFAIVGTGTTCTNGSTVAAAGTCVVKVTFTPTALGAQTATITFTDDATPTTQVVNVTGTGVFPQAGPAPTTIQFGSQTNGITSGPQTVTLTNNGTDVLHITTVALGGTNPGAFAIVAGTTTCTNGGTVNPGSSCVVNVTFTPTGLTAFAATLTFTDDATPTTQAVNLAGTGVTSTVNFSPSPVAFGNQRQAVASTQKTTVLTNSGSGTLTITSVTLAGTNPADFALVAPSSGTDCRTVGTVPAAGTCTIAVTFTPAALGGRSATITVADNASGSPHTAAVTGTGVFPQATPTPSPLPFGNQRQNTTSTVQTLTLTNGGTDTLNLTSVVLAGTNASQFAIVGTGTTCTNGSTVAAAGTCVVKVTFTPTALGAQTATITFTDDATPTTQVVNLTGTGVFPQATPTPSPLQFGNQRQNTTSTVQTLTLTNGGTGTLNLTSVALAGTNASQFAIVGTGTTCTNGSTVAAAGTCVVKVTFTPTALGAQTATITFTDDATPTTQVVNVTGTGVFPQAGPAPTTIQFGSQTNGITSGPQTVTLTNNGTDVLHITTVALGGTNPGAFAIVAGTTTCTNGGTVNPGSSCVVNVTFTPTGLTAFAATLTFTDDATPTTQAVNLAGTGVTSTVNFSPSPVAFGNQRQAVASTQKTTVLTNSGSGTLTITSVTLAGTNPADFVLVAPSSGTDCRTVGTVPAAGTCTIAVTFTPAALGGRSATISVADNASGSPHTAAVTGTGVFPQATPTPSPLPFGNQRQNTTSTVQTLTLTNGGTDTLNLTSVALAGTNASQFAIVGTGTTCTNGSTVAAAGTCVVKVTFTPTALGAQTATITFTDDATPTTQVVNLTGTGVFPQATPTPSPLQFGNQRQNTTSTVQTLTLTNGGTGTLNLTSVALAGTNASQFAIVGTGTTCTNGSTVAAAGTCVVKMTFTPTALGAQTATITFTDDATPTTQVVNVTGTGVFPQAGPAPTTIQFGSQTNGITSGPQTVTLTNNGTDVLHITTVALGGTNPGAFAIVAGTTTCTNGGTVNPGSSCVVNVTFTPTGLTAFAATLTFTDDATPTTQAVNLAGTGVTSTVNFSPSPVAFGNQRQAVASTQKTTVLTNSGSGTLTITSVTLAGTNPADFALVAPSSGTDCRTVGTVPAAGTCTIAVTFTPAALGGRSATISVADNASGSPHTAAVTGTGVFPQATPTPSPLVAFANQVQGTTSTPLTVTLTNGGTDILHITTVALGGTNPADFAIATGTTCTNGSTVAAGNTCIVNLTFTPATANAFTATLTFTDDASPTTQTVNLSGTGVTPPTATLSAGSIAFGNQRVNTVSTAQNVTITNNGGAPLSITSIAISGTNPSNFAFASPATTCPTAVSGQIAPASSCTLSVTFGPTASGARSASITITVSGIANPAPITLTGTGIAPVATPSGTGAFGNQEVSASSAALNGTLNNTGTDVLHITAVAITGANAADFSIITSGTSCATGLPAPVNVAAAGNCTWSVKFTPTALGARTASLTFTDDSDATAGSTQTVALSGTGTAPVVQLAPTTVSFPATAVGTPSAPLNGTLTNTGTTTLHLATVTITGTNAGDFAIAAGGTTCTNGATVAPTNGTCTWSVTFTPSAAGTRTATLTFTDDNNGVPGSTQTVGLTGITPPSATLSSNTIAFGNQGVGTASNASPITLTNPGGSTLHITTVAISGTNAADFAVATTGTTCTNGSTVAPAASCVINVTFTPAAAAARTGTLTITDDATPATQTASLSGTGISFSLSVPTPPAPAIAGTPITATIQLTPGPGGFPNAVTFSASNLPPDTTGAFSQTTVTPGSSVVTTTLTLTTTVRSGGNSLSAPPSHPSRWPISGGWIATALLALLAMGTMRRGFRMQRFSYLPLAVLLLSAAIITGCTTAATGTPAGPYTVNVKATSGNYSQTTPVTITVQ